MYIREIFYRSACGDRTTEICKDLAFKKKDRPVPSRVSSTVVYNIIQGCRPLFDDVLGVREVKESKGRAV